MKSGILLLLILFPAVLPAETWADFNQHRNQVNQYGMLTLGSWAALNIVSGSVLFSQTEGDSRYFHQMNAAWNVINLGIAAFGYYNALHADVNMDPAASVAAQKQIENILLFNAGLDVGYIMTGFYLRERAKRSDKHTERLKGYGNSIILQGGFLFAFDVALFYFQQQNSPLLSDLLSHIAFGNGYLTVSIPL